MIKEDNYTNDDNEEKLKRIEENKLKYYITDIEKFKFIEMKPKNKTIKCLKSLIKKEDKKRKIDKNTNKNNTGKKNNNP